MDLYLRFILFLPVVILLLIGSLIKYKKAYWMISGYNTMSAEKKRNVDIEGLGRLSANLCFVLAALIFVAVVLILLGHSIISVLLFFLLIPIVIAFLIVAQKYDRNTRNKEGKMKTGSKVIIGSVISFLVLVSIGVGFMLYFSFQPAEYTLQNGTLNISGMYGEKIAVKDISRVELLQTLPAILNKTNGSAIGNIYKGHFRVSGIDDVTLFINGKTSPFILIKTNTDYIIFNCVDSGKTETLYKELKSKK